MSFIQLAQRTIYRTEDIDNITRAMIIARPDWIEPLNAMRLSFGLAALTIDTALIYEGDYLYETPTTWRTTCKAEGTVT